MKGQPKAKIGLIAYRWMQDRTNVFDVVYIESTVLFGVT